MRVIVAAAIGVSIGVCVLRGIADLVVPRRCEWRDVLGGESP